MLVFQSTYDDVCQRNAELETDNRATNKLLDAKNLELTKTKSLLTQTKYDLDCTDNIYKELKRSVEADVVNVRKLCETVTGKDPRSKWFVGGKRVPLAESRISLMTHSLDSEHFRLSQEFEKVQREKEEIWNHYKSDDAAWAKQKKLLTNERDLARRAREQFKGDFTASQVDAGEMKEKYAALQDTIKLRDEEIARLKAEVATEKARVARVEGRFDALTALTTENIVNRYSNLVNSANKRMRLTDGSDQ
jgi:hypothetical protein